MAYTNRNFTWDFDALKRFYEKYIVKWLNSAVNWTEAQKKQARANLGFGNGDIDSVPTAGSDNILSSDALYNELYNEEGIQPEYTTISGTVSEPYEYYSDEVSIPIGAVVTNIGNIGVSLREDKTSSSQLVKLGVGETITLEFNVTRIRTLDTAGDFSIKYTMDGSVRTNTAVKIKKLNEEVNDLKDEIASGVGEFGTGEKVKELSISRSIVNDNKSILSSDALYNELYNEEGIQPEYTTISGTIDGEATSNPWWSGVCDIPSGATVINDGSINLILYTQKGSSDYTRVSAGDTVLLAHNVTRLRGNKASGDFSIKYTMDGSVRTNTAVKIKKLNEEVDSISDRIRGNSGNQFKHSHVDVFNDGDEIVLEENCLANYKLYTFKANHVDTMGTLRLHHGDGVSEYYSGYVEITNSKIIIHKYRSSALEPVEYTHDLTIRNTLSFTLRVDEKANEANIELVSNGSSFNISNVDWQVSHGTVKLVNSGSTMSDVSFCYGTTHYDKDILIVGASYLGHTSAHRWPYYMIQRGYDNYILNNFPGAKAANGINDVNVLLTHFTPKAIFWCYGMNNVDTEEAINPLWLSAYNTIKEICEDKGIELILMTYPTARGGSVEDTDIRQKRINKWKNAIIRESGFRYVDIDKAMGANETTGEWYDGFLSDDGVHPTEAGALEMFYAVISTIPELAGKK